METVPETNLNSTPQPLPCVECASGLMRLRSVTYFTWLGEELITVPDFPAWTCDVCGRCEFDERDEAWLKTILNPETGRTAALKRVSPRPRPRPAGLRPNPEQP